MDAWSDAGEASARSRKGERRVAGAFIIGDIAAMRSFVGGACVLLVALQLGAQQPAGAARVAQSRDTTGADSVRAQQLGRIVVSGARLAPSADPRLPRSVQRIGLPPVSRERTTTEILAKLPGVSTSNDQGTRAQPSFDVRGFTLSPVVGAPQGVSVFLDGVRVNEPDAQEVNFDLLPMDAVASAELLSGPSSVFGKNSLAGALLLRTARGTAEPELHGELGVGSFGEREGHVRASGMLGGTDGLFLVSASGDDGYQQRSGARTRQAFANLGRRSDASDIGLSLLVARDRLYEAGSLPESWLAVARRANYTGGDFFHPRLTQLSAHGSWQVNGVALRSTAFVRRNAIEQLNVNAGNPDTHAFVTNGSAGATAELSASTTLAGRPLALSVGAEATRARVSYLVNAEPNAESPTLPPDCAPAPDGASALCEDARVNSDDAGLYAQSILQVTPRLAATLSARGDYSRVPFRDLRDPANDGTSVFTRLSPELGITYTVARLRAYASAGSGFRAPAALELACASPEAACPLPFSLGDDPPLRPVVAWSFESGGEWSSGTGTTLALSLFDTEVHDEIAFASTSGVSGYFTNVPRTRRRGMETRFSLLLPATSRLFGSWTLVDATYRSAITLASALDENEVAPGDHFALSPRHRGTLGLTTTQMIGGAALEATFSARGASSAWLRGDEANTQPPLPGYVVADLSTALQLGRFTLSGSVQNVFDRKYEIYGVYAENSKGAYGSVAPATPTIERFLTPAYPRTVRIGLGF